MENVHLKKLNQIKLHQLKIVYILRIKHKDIFKELLPNFSNMFLCFFFVIYIDKLKFTIYYLACKNIIRREKICLEKCKRFCGLA